MQSTISWNEALEIVIARTKHERFRALTFDDNPDAAQREAYRALMVRMATGEPTLEPDPPTPEDLALRADLARRPCCP